MILRDAVLASVAISATLVSSTALAGVCTVPGSHPSVQGAIDDVACSDIVLANQMFSENLLIDRPLAITGTGSGQTIVMGQVNVATTASSLTLSMLGIHNACRPTGLNVAAGAEVDGDDLRVVTLAAGNCIGDQIFKDGFEGSDP